MKRILLGLILVLSLLFLIGCQETMTDQELAAISEEELNAAETDDSALAGEAVKVSKVVATTCVDTDAGQDEFVAGTVTQSLTQGLKKGKLTFTDECVDDKTVKEYFCFGKLRSSILITCDLYCANGACENFPECVPHQCVYLDYAGGVKECGIIDNGCGGTVNCGDCPRGYNCPSTTNQCEPLPVPSLNCDLTLLKNDLFRIGEITFEYKSADNKYKTSPVVKFKLSTGETIEMPVSFNSAGVASFTLNHEGLSYNFISASDTSVDDWSIQSSCEVPVEELAELSCDQSTPKNVKFTLGGTGFEYKGADRMTKTSPMIKFKNLETGETQEYAPQLAVVFEIKDHGYATGFASSSETYLSYNSDDYDITLVYPCGLETACGSLISSGQAFTLHGVRWQYQRADRITKLNPMISFKNYETGEVIEYTPYFATYFDLKTRGIAYSFQSASDYNVDDYAVKLMSPCPATTG